LENDRCSETGLGGALAPSSSTTVNSQGNYTDLYGILLCAMRTPLEPCRATANFTIDRPLPITQYPDHAIIEGVVTSSLFCTRAMLPDSPQTLTQSFAPCSAQVALALTVLKSKPADLSIDGKPKLRFQATGDAEVKAWQITSAAFADKSRQIMGILRTCCLGVLTVPLSGRSLTRNLKRHKPPFWIHSMNFSTMVEG
jgi:hypothetical protein